MRASIILLILVSVSVTLFQVAQSQSTDQQCGYLYGNWATCVEGVRNRTVDCVCDRSVMADLSACKQQQLAEPDVMQNCEDIPEEEDEPKVKDLVCNWRWSKWSTCSQPCGGGSTSRVQLCICPDSPLPVVGKFCRKSLPLPLEAVPCNEYECGSKAAFNKLFWVDQVQRPIDDSDFSKILYSASLRTFNCSKGVDPESDAKDSPKGKNFIQILMDRAPEDHKNYQWYLLGKEYVASLLNKAYGVYFGEEANRALEEVADLLEDCRGYSDDVLLEVYAEKERLSRMNNNIGGLENVDQQMKLFANGGYSLEEETPQQKERRQNWLGVLIGLPIAVALLSALIVGLSVYYVRSRSGLIVVEHAQFDSEDDEEPLHKGGSGDHALTAATVGLDAPVVDTGAVIEGGRGDSSSEE